MAASDATLADKLAALERITRIAGWPWCIRQNASEKMEEGHYANRGVRPCADVNCAFEGTEEACDLAGYAALAKVLIARAKQARENTPLGGTDHDPE